ncbi:non-ribosomal peptide synthetase [Pedobacter steynii]|uniref:Carrier domain-containing protein n=1 Tax=Pedobacter steynii TaxID=430522 RepID=A0A1D7QJA3_9SPHI|nr:non-ribosomal peptide synthetase [Pedobacter steynii]AOM78751.1 hypothetical protein BFS30_17160 [Pedobacter steynii]
MEGKIKKTNVQDILELSDIQKGMLFHFLHDTGQNLYNIQLSFNILGQLDADRLKSAFKQVQRNHDVLRSVFEWEKSKVPLQIILKESDLNFSYQDISSYEGTLIRQWSADAIAKDRQEKFDLRNTPFRVSLIKISATEFILNITHHHILYDGWSTGILLKELFSTYNNFEAETVDKVSYKQVFQELKGKYDKSSSESFWIDYLSLYEVTPVFGLKPLSGEFTEKLKTYHSEYPIDALNEFSTSSRITKAAVIYTAYGLLLQRYRDTTDIVFGTPVSNRSSSVKGSGDVMGNFINTIPLRVCAAKEESLSDILKKVNNELLDRAEYSSTSYSDIKGLLSLNPADTLFDSILVIENYPLDIEAINYNSAFDINLRSAYGDTGIPVVVHVFFREKLEIEVIYQTRLVSEEFVERFAFHFSQVIEAIINRPDENALTFNYLTEEETQNLLYDYNDTKVTENQKNTVLELFSDQVVSNPDAIAVCADSRVLTYKELNTLSDVFANHLNEDHGIGTNDMVGVILERNDWLVIAILGILKSGAAFIPIDPEYPADRKAAILAGSGSKLLVSEAYYVFENDFYDGPIFIADLEFDEHKYQSVPLKHQVGCNDLAYVIYTSGSTGNPKGVMIEHGSLLNYVSWAAKKYVRKGRSNCPLYTSISFDLTITSIFIPLITGGKILVYKDESIDVLIKKVINNQECDIIKFTPSHLKLIKDGEFDLDDINPKVIIVGGEQLESRLAMDIYMRFKGNADIFNEYGPTEATVGCMIYQFHPAVLSEVVPIGRPIDNTKIYLFDQQMNPVPKGVAGALFVAGAGLARGYLHREDLTNEKFVMNPFVEGERLYKTGDLAIRMPSGDLEYIGRIDSQVKIRGYRIELGDIEHHVGAYPSIKNAVVVVYDYPDGKNLCCYYTSEREIDQEKLRYFLSQRLPGYMVPFNYIFVERIPLTINGKPALKLLPDPRIPIKLQSYVPPTTELEQTLVSIWEEVLDIEKVGLNDDFFVLGGHSLTAIRLISKLKNVLAVSVSINAFFEYKTIGSLAVYIGNLEKNKDAQILKKRDKPVRLPLSFGQERLWFLDQMDGSVHYHLPLVLKLEGELDPDVLLTALQALINRHEPLRTVIRSSGGIPFQVVLPIDSWNDFIIKDIEGFMTQETGQLIETYSKASFDLSKDHMIRARLLRNVAGFQKLILVIHHIAFDGWSTPIFLKELASLYGTLKLNVPDQLPGLPITYSDYSSWQQSDLQGDLLEEGLRYWESKLGGVQPLNLAADFARPGQISYRGRTHRVLVDKSLSQELTDLAHAQGCSLFMTFLTVLKVLLFRYTAQNDICIGTPVANRQQSETEHMIGFFANTIALRSELNGDMSFVELIGQVKKTMLEAYEYQQVPFEKVIDRLVKERDFSHSPLFQVMFILENEPLKQLEFEGWNGTPEWLERDRAKFELTFEVIQGADGTEVLINYFSDLFNEDTIKRMLVHYVQLMKAVVAEPDSKIKDLNILHEEEHRELLGIGKGVRTNYRSENTVIDLFRKQVKRTPDATALIFEKESLSYQELDRRSNQLARLLIEKGVLTNILVPICLERSFEMVIGILGILKIGAAYVPIDPEFPENRINFILEDTGAEILLSSTAVAEKLKLESNVKCFTIDDPKLFASCSEEEIVATVLPEDLAYTIYTSGTTGRPKGVQNQHSGLLNRLLWMQDYLDLNQRDVVLQKTTFCFDVSVWELLSSLICGGVMVLARPEGHKDADYLQELIQRHQVTTIHFVPSMLAVFLLRADAGKCSSLRSVICSGEELKLNTVSAFQELFNDIDLYNFYGPTEAAIDVTAIKLDRTANFVNRIPIGKPVANTYLYIVDQNGRLQPRGVTGELLIGGVQVALRYLNRVELTAQKFIPNQISPFLEGCPVLYRTGDLVRWLPDGNIEFLGRIDDQVKIRGYRIEPAEIEATLGQLSGVKHAVVLIKERGEDKYLVAFVKLENGVDIDSLSNQLKSILPQYMVPAVMVKVDEFPLTINGKIDRNQLNVTTLPLIAETYVAPRNEVELKLTKIWQDLLKTDRVGVLNDFFALGGHSLLAIRVLSEISNEFSVNISITLFFQLRTIEKLSAYLEVLQSAKELSVQENVNTIEL